MKFFKCANRVLIRIKAKNLRLGAYGFVIFVSGHQKFQHIIGFCCLILFSTGRRQGVKDGLAVVWDYHITYGMQSSRYKRTLLNMFNMFHVVSLKERFSKERDSRRKRRVTLRCHRNLQPPTHLCLSFVLGMHFRCMTCIQINTLRGEVS